MNRALPKLVCTMSPLSVLFLFLFALSSYAAIDVTVDVTGAEETGSTLSKKVFVERLELYFPNKRGSQSVSQNSKGFYASARFKYLGNGPLTARWLVDDRVISQTTELLSFGKEVEIRSDKNKVYLPTFIRGTHKVSVQLLNSSGIIDLTARSIQYFVTDGVAEFQPGTGLTLMHPKDRSVDPLNFHFRWKGMENFQAYHLEVERLASKSVKSATVIKALSKIDVYAPSDIQRSDLLAGAYRWRVKGLYSDKKMKPLVSEWANFDVAGQASKGGVFITAMKASGKASETASSQQSRQTKIQPGQRVTKSKLLIGQGKMTGGETHLLTLKMQNSGLADADNLLVELKNGGELIGLFPVSVKAGNTREVTFPIEAAASDTTRLEAIGVIITDGSDTLDEAALNLTVEPNVDIGALDFVELNNNFSAGNAALTFCPGQTASPDLIFSRMVSAHAVGNLPEQFLNQQGYFNFDEGQQIQLTAYLQDRGLGAWFDEHCPDTETTLPNGQTVTVRHSSNLGFLAYPVDQNGQVNGAAINMGYIAFVSGMDGMVTSPEWTIPESGQYKITLHDISEPADLYATLPGGFPKYIHAAGFDLELLSATGKSGITSTQPRQALIAGDAITSWKGDTAQSTIQLTLDNITVNMFDNPLHGEYAAGEIESTSRVDLSLSGHSFALKRFSINHQGAIANLDYRLPDGYFRSDGSPNDLPALQARLTKTTTPAVSNSARVTDFLQSGRSTAQSKSGSANLTLTQNSQLINAISIVPPNVGELVSFNGVNVFNGGEFIARYAFDSSWDDLKLRGDDLALRLNGAQLIADTSEHVNYSDYSSESGFTGIGFIDTLLRVKVNLANELFTVNNSHEAFIYGKAHWLEITSGGLSGEDIEVQRVDSFADFFNQTAAKEVELSKPFGFKLQITGGVLSLENSTVGGVDLSGSLSLPNNDNTSVISSHQLDFENLQRSRNQFMADITQDSSLHLDFGVFHYQPETLRLLIGKQVDSLVSYSENASAPSFDTMNHTGLLRWRDNFYLSQEAGLLLTNGVLSKNWDSLTEGDSSEMSAGKFLLNGSGLKGQWLDVNNADSPTRINSFNYLINGFDTTLEGAWFNFKDSALIDSKVSGAINIPYPVDQSFKFTGSMDQEAGLFIAEDGLLLPVSLTGETGWDLHYWKARLSSPVVTGSGNTGNGITLNTGLPTVSPAGRDIPKTGTQTELSEPKLLFDSINRLIKIENFELQLLVSDGEDEDLDLGGEEFVAKDKKPPFLITTHINPDGQLTQTAVSPAGSDIRFLGQQFELESIDFAPYVGNGQPPAAGAVPTALPLVNIKGQVGFSVFGLQDTEIHHTALGAQVPLIAPAFQESNGDGYYGDEGGAVKVHAELKFVNTYGRDAAAISLQVNRTQGNADDAEVNFQPFKAFVGEAEMVLIDAFSMKGLAEAGLHKQQDLPDDASGNWGEEGEEVAYERIGLGAGVDIVKATIAGLRGMETVTRLGGGAIATVTGVEGMGEQAIELGVESVVFVEAVAMALAPLLASNPPLASEILHAIDSGLATTNKGIELLRAICEDPDSKLGCDANTLLLLDISSIMLRSAGVVTHFDQVDPQEIASIVLQTIDTSIPLLKQIDADAMAVVAGVNLGTTLNDKHEAALSLAHTPVVAARSLVDHNGNIPFNDFIRISGLFIDSIEDVRNIPEIGTQTRQLGADSLINLSIALARQSVNMAKDIKNNPNPQKLAALANQFFDVMCAQTDNMTPLFPVELRQTPNLMKPVMSVSSVVLNKLSESEIPSSSQQLAISFLRSVLESMISGETGSAACGGNSIAIPDEAKGMLTIAWHMLEPLTWQVHSDDIQVVWSLKSVKYSLEVMVSIAANTSVDMSDAADMQLILDNLINTFSTIGSGVNTDQSIASGQRVLRLAAGIPAAFSDLLIKSGSDGSKASEVLEVYVVLMRQLDKLLNHADEIAGNNFDNIDLLELPIQLISKTQNLSFLGQNEKLGLSSVSHILTMSREVTSEKPKLTKLMQDVRAIHRNIKIMGGDSPNNLAKRQEVEQVMVLMEMLAEFADDSQQLQSMIANAIVDLIPLFVINPNQFSVEEMARFLNSIRIAFPIVDFSQSDRKGTLDEVLPELLDQAEKEATSPEDKQKIKRARGILAAADRQFVGFSVVYLKDAQGNEIEKQLPVSAKEILPDGSSREFNFRTVPPTAKHSYPQHHTDFNPPGSDLSKGDFSETSTITLPGDFDFINLPAQNKTTLFSDYWSDLLQSGDFIKRRYTDVPTDQNAANRIAIEATEGHFKAKIISTVSKSNFSEQRELQLGSMPNQSYPTASQLDQHLTLSSGDKILSATVIKRYDPVKNPACTFTSDCSYSIVHGSNQFVVNSVSNPRHRATYESDSAISYSTKTQISFNTATPAGAFTPRNLVKYYGSIQSDTAGWNTTWISDYRQGVITILEGDSFEKISITGDVATVQQLVTSSTASNTFIKRRSVVGNVIWDYNTTTRKALFSDGVGNWEIFQMPESFNSSVVIPNPPGVINPVGNGFTSLAKKQGEETTNPAGLAEEGGSINIPSPEPGSSITIGPGGDISIGGQPIDLPTGGADIDKTEEDENGDSKVTLGDGSIIKVITPIANNPEPGTDPGNLKITRIDRPNADGNRRTRSTVEYCKDKTKSVENCPANELEKETFEYDTTPNFIDTGHSCPPITPVTGVNQEIKHQIWVQFFRMEAELFSDPSKPGLDALLQFAKQAIEEGLDAEEVQEQYKCVFEKIANKLAAKHFDVIEQAAGNTQQQDDWDENPAQSPFKKLSDLFGDIASLWPDGDGPDFSDASERYKEVMTIKLRKRYQEIPNTDDINTAANSFSQAGASVLDKLAKYIRGLMELEGFKQSIGELNSGAIAEACEVINSVVDGLYEKYNVGNNNANSPQMTEDDIQLILQIEGNREQMGCLNGDSALSELAELAESAGLDATDLGGANIPIDLEGSLNYKFGLFYKKVKKAIKGANEVGYATESQLREAYIKQLLGVDFISEFLPATSDKNTLFVDHIFKLQRLIQLVDSNENTQQVITSVEFNRMQDDLIEGLKQGWKNAWDTQYNIFTDAFNNDHSRMVTALNELGVLYEKAKLLNLQMDSPFISEAKRKVIELSSILYLNVTVLNQSYDVIGHLKVQQQTLHDSLWLQVLAEADLNQKLQLLPVLEDAVGHIKRTAKAGKSGGIASFDDRIEPLIAPYFETTSDSLAAFEVNTESAVDDVLRSGEQIYALLNAIDFPLSKPLFSSKVTALTNQTMEAINNSNQNIQSYKLVTIARVYKNEEIDLQSLSSLDVHIDVKKKAVDSLLAQITPSKVDALLDSNQSSKVRDIIKKILDLESQIALSGGTPSSFDEILPAIESMVQAELEKLDESSDLKFAKSVFQLEAEYQQMGGEDGNLAEISAAIINKSKALRDSLETCIGTRTCTVNHTERWIELVEAENAIGRTGLVALDTLDQMRDSSPVTWEGSAQHQYSISELIGRVKIHIGRRIVANELQRLVDSLNLNNEADRVVLRTLVENLEKLAQIPLDNGRAYSLNDANDRDPLSNVLEPLRGDLYLWQAEKQDAIEVYLKDHPEALSAAGRKELADQFAISEAEISSVILQAINNSMPMTPVAGSKYKAAANLLKTVPDKKNAALLSFQLLDNTPDPDYASDSEFLAASIGEMSKYIANQLVGNSQVANNRLQPTQQQMMTALSMLLKRHPEYLPDYTGTVKTSSTLPLVAYASLLEDLMAAQNGTADFNSFRGNLQELFDTLLSLPGNEQPVDTLATLLKRQLLNPLLGGELKCANGAMACLLNTGLRVMSLSLDSLVSEQTNLADPIEILLDMTAGLSDLTNSEVAEEFLIGLAAEGLNLTLQLSNGQSTVENLAAKGFDFSITLLQAKIISDHIPPPVKPVTNFILAGSEKFEQLLTGSGDLFPIAIARISSDFVFAAMGEAVGTASSSGVINDDATAVANNVLTLGRTVSNWNLDFANNNWDLLMSINASTGIDTTKDILQAFVGSGGIAQLTCDINAVLPAEIPNMPPAITLTPFVALNELLTLKDKEGRPIDINSVPQQERVIYLIDVAAGLSNLWFADPMSCQGIATSDKPIATLIRKIRDIEITEGGELAALSTVGNMGLGAIEVLLEGDPAVEVLQIAWNGAGDIDNRSPGIATALELGMNAEGGNLADAADLLEFTSKVPATMSAIMDKLAGANSPASTALRLVTGNLQTPDLLAPDKPIGDGNSGGDLIKHIKYAIPNGLLGILGIVRKGMTPGFEGHTNRTTALYVDDADYGYLKALSVLELDSNGNIQISSADAITADLQHMSGQDPTEQATLMFLAGADFARLGISALTPLLEYEPGDNSANVAAINQRAIFSDLAGSGAGFSGVSGGLQREWEADNWVTPLGAIDVQMYARLHIPIVLEDTVGLLALHTESGLSTLEFSSAINGVGVESAINATLSIIENKLEMKYEGLLDVDFLGQSVAEINGSGFVRDFSAPHPDDLSDPAGYAIDLAKKISIGQCFSATANVVNPPLSFVLPATAGVTLGTFAEKIGTESFMLGSRSGLSGTFKAAIPLPPIVLPLGVTLGGQMTTAYTISPFNPEQLPDTLDVDSCVTGGFSLDFFGTNIPLGGAEAEVKAFVKGEGETGFKFKMGPDTGLTGGLSALLGCETTTGNAAVDTVIFPVKKPFCDAADKFNTLWGVVKLRAGSGGLPEAKVTLGVGDSFPSQGEPVMHFSYDSSAIVALPIPGFAAIANEDAGWPSTAQSIPNLCAVNLCLGEDGSVAVGH